MYREENIARKPHFYAFPSRMPIILSSSEAHHSPIRHPVERRSLTVYHHRQNAELDYDIASILSEFACQPLDDEIEQLESLLPSCASRSRLGEARV
jgi:hypothetical protein